MGLICYSAAVKFGGNFTCFNACSAPVFSLKQHQVDELTCMAY